MNTIEVLKIIKKKLFEPRKKIVFDTTGKRILVDCPLKDRYNNVSNDGDILEDAEGWNVADKDYVDLKFSELYKLIQYSPPAPSAPPIHSPSKKQIQSSTQTVVFFETGKNIGDTITFFSPGIFMQKNWVISGFSILGENVFEEDVIFYMKYFGDTKPVQLSKMKITGQQLIVSDGKHKIDQTKPVVFLIKSIKPITFTVNLQVTVEM